MSGGVHFSGRLRMGLVDLVSTLMVAVAIPAQGHGDVNDQITGISLRIRENPTRAELYLKRAELFRTGQEWQRASGDYDQAEKLDPGLDGVHLGRARMWLALSKFDDAKIALERYLTLHPAHEEATVMLGRAEAGRGRYLVSAEHFARAIALSPRPQPDYYLERATALAAAGGENMVRAVRCIDEGLAKLGILPALELFAVDLELKLHHFDSALARLERLSAVSKRKDTWLARRGDILMSAGRKPEALVAYRSAMAAIALLPAHLRGTKSTVALHSRLTQILSEENQRSASVTSD